MSIEAGATYAGDLSADDAWAMLEADRGVVLVDVRTLPEWSFVGVPDLSSLGKETVFLDWQVYPDMSVRADFIEALQAALSASGGDKTAPVLFLCRSGVRSKSAAIAATRAGFTRAYNISGGFEGPPDAAGHRGVVAGWKAQGLPWAQR